MNIGIIGGSGANDVIKSLGVNAKEHITDSNNLNGVDYIHFKHNDDFVVFILRHGKEHTRDPARLDARSIVQALESIFNFNDIDEIKPETTPRLIIQTSASGSLDTSIKLVDDGGIVVCSDVMRGFGFTTTTFSGKNDRDLHAVMSNPFSEKARRLALDAIAKVNGAIGYDGGIYVNNQGNQFETRAEVAALYSWLDQPACMVDCYSDLVTRLEKEIAADLKNTHNTVITDSLNRYKAKLTAYESLAKSLTVRQATVSMNAAKEVPLLKEAGFDNIVLLSFPVNYGVGLIPDEKVDHQRTVDAISKATAPYIAPVLKNMIEMAREYIR